MERPRTVDIGGLQYKIKYVKPGSDPLLGEEEFGSVTPYKRIISIDKNLDDDVCLLTLLHEFLHVIGDTIESNKSPFCKEGFTCTVAHLLFQALQSSGLLPKHFKS